MDTEAEETKYVQEAEVKPWDPGASESSCQFIMMPSNGVNAAHVNEGVNKCMNKLLDSHGNLAASFLYLTLVPLPPAPASLLCSWLSTFICSYRMRAFSPLPMLLQDPPDFPVRPPVSLPFPALEPQQLALPAPSSANQTFIVLPHVEYPANCQSQRAHQTSSARSCTQAPVPKRMVIASSVSPFQSLGVAGKKPKWLGREGLVNCYHWAGSGLASEKATGIC